MIRNKCKVQIKKSTEEKMQANPLENDDDDQRRWYKEKETTRAASVSTNESRDLDTNI